MFTIAFHPFTPFNKIQRYQRPDSFSAFITSVSSTVRLIWDVHYANRGHNHLFIHQSVTMLTSNRQPDTIQKPV